MSSQRVPCEICREQVDPMATGTCRWTAGWTERRSGGRGGIRCAEYEDLYAHKHCVDLKATGRLRQAAMFS